MNISSELKELVSQSVKLLGQVIQDIYGTELYQQIESLRLKMKSVRGKPAEDIETLMNQVLIELKSENNLNLHRIAQAFSLMLELINSCEAAYRASRLKNYKIKSNKRPHGIIYVFTSHPTEARSRDFLEVITKAENLLIDGLEEGFEKIADRLEYLLKIAVRISLANNRRPQVKDEVEQIFHLVLGPHVLDEQIALKKNGYDVQFRSWVGGDKDGHPLVGPSTMVQSLQFSRKRLIHYAKSRITQYKSDLELLQKNERPTKSLIALEKNLMALKVLRPGDGSRVAAMKKSFKKLKEEAKKLNLVSPDLENLENLFWLYPALVLPLEIREDSALIHEAISNTNRPIAMMLKKLKALAKGLDCRWYVRGFICSMCQSSGDTLAAMALTEKILGELAIPVVPLFENEKGLSNSVTILQETFKARPIVSEHKKRFGGRFEVMLGYSDSSKENGVLPARLMVEKGLNALDNFLTSSGLTPVFFHGSGGSTSRGGGSVQEQTSWLPESALDIYKVTIQGEMVQRNFSQPLIMRSLVGKTVEALATHQTINIAAPSALHKFTSSIQVSYRHLVNDEKFQELVTLATPYQYLSLLRIGSRPAKRSGKGVFTLRAIPWILCWTQTRLLLPVWWGSGSAWEKLSQEEKDGLKKFSLNSPIMQSYIKNFGFTLARIELGVWNFHIEHSALTEKEKRSWRECISRELELSITFFQEISGEKNFTWYRPWLGESIHFRSSMIHPLNVIQKLAIERGDNVLLRETVTGIACGMLTTG